MVIPISGNSDVVPYSELNKLVKKSSNIRGNNWALRIATEVEEAASRGQHREVWAKVKKISGESKINRVSYVGDEKGKMITDNQKDRWKEHFTELLNPPLSSVNLGDLEVNNVSEQPNF